MPAKQYYTHDLADYHNIHYLCVSKCKRLLYIDYIVYIIERKMSLRHLANDNGLQSYLWMVYVWPIKTAMGGKYTLKAPMVVRGKKCVSLCLYTSACAVPTMVPTTNWN